MQKVNININLLKYYSVQHKNRRTAQTNNPEQAQMNPEPGNTNNPPTNKVAATVK